MTKSDVKLRDEFETWASSLGFDITRYNIGCYRDPTQQAWAAWLYLARHTDHLLEMAVEALKSGKMCAEILANQGGACGTEIREEELPFIDKTPLTLQQHTGKV